MKYNNPIVKGFYPDPSVCRANGKFYMVCSSFQYFPGVPLFESENLINWTQIGHVLTRKNQIMLEKINSSGGVFAPTIRFNNGRFYMVTTNDTTHENFFVYTDNIYGEWSDPVRIEQGGIDPSLFFEDGKTYFMSNGTDENGKGAVIQCEINAETGEKLSESRAIWNGSGGRYLESPHLYEIDGKYYLMAAEGGTEYGHMITYAMGNSPYGKFENYPKNPVLTNRNKAPFIIQGIGHGDLIQDYKGNWFILSLGFRQIGEWMPYHHLGREVFLTPVKFGDDGWFSAGADGTTDFAYEIQGDFQQIEKKQYTFENTNWNIDWCFLRHPHTENYTLSENALLTGTQTTLDDVASPTFVGIRQRDFCGELSCNVSAKNGEAGITAYMCENEHFDIAIRENEDGFEAILKLNIGGIKHLQNAVKISGNNAVLKISFDSMNYRFYVIYNNTETYLGNGQAKYLSSEVSSGFTGVLFGLYAVNGLAEFNNFNCQYK